MISLSDAEIKRKAARWRNPILRGDVTRTYAVQECVGDITYPYADASQWAYVHAIVRKVIENI